MPISCPSSSRVVKAWKPYGELYFRPFCQTSGENKAVSFGQVSEANISYEIEEDSLPDNILGVGEAASDSRIASMALQLVCHEPGDFDVLSLLLLGSQASAALDAAAEETTAKLYLGAPLWLDNIPTSVTSIVATDGDAADDRANSTEYSAGDDIVPATPNGYWYRCTTGGTSDSSPPTFGTTAGGTTADNTVVWTCMGLITLVANTDYTVGDFVIDISDTARIYTGASNTVGVDATITYAHAAQSIVHAGMNTGSEYEILFTGYNKAASDEKHLVHISRAKSAPPDSFPLISREYAGLTATFKLLSNSGASSSESAFFNVRKLT